MTKLLATITLVFITLGSPLMALSLKGQFVCKIKAQHIMKIEEGKASEYSSIKDGLKVGDSIVITYELGSDIHVVENYGDPTIEVSVEPNYSVLLSRNDAVAPVWMIKPDYIVAKHGADIIHFQPNRIGVDGSKGKIHLKRYYKNDWSGMFFNSNFLMSHVYGLDCRHPEDVIDKIFSYLNKVNN